MQKPPGGVLVCYPHIGLLYFIVLYEGSISYQTSGGVLFNFTWENKIQKNISFPYLLLESVTSRLHYNIK